MESSGRQRRHNQVNDAINGLQARELTRRLDTKAATQTLPMEVPPEIWQRIATLETRVELLSTKTSRDFASAGVRFDRLELQSSDGTPLENIGSKAFRKKARPVGKEVRQRVGHHDARQEELIAYVDRMYEHRELFRAR